MTNAPENPAWKTSLNNTVSKLLAALEDASQLTVETRIFKVGAGDGGGQAPAGAGPGKLVARTVIKADGDTSNGLPVIDEEKGEVHENLLNLHNQSVDRALKYRAELVNSTVDIARNLIAMLKES